MTRRIPDWYAKPGLAGGIDKDGSRADELLAMGFGSVEFGSVMPEAMQSTAARLASLSPMRMTAIGAGVGLPAEWPADDLGKAWLAGLNGLWPVVDYLSFNLSAAANRRFLLPEHHSRLTLACLSLKARRDNLALAHGRYLPLALKMPLGACAEPLSALVSLANSVGFDQLTLVLPDEAGRFERLENLANALHDGPALVAVGSIRSAADVAAARQAGAVGIQVHRLFVEQGAACLATLAPA